MADVDARYDGDRPVTSAPELRETQAFFAARAAGWEDRFPDDTPQFRRAIQEMELPPETAVLDLGCGTGRALPLLRATIGRGLVVGLDATPAMLAEARRLGRHTVGDLILGDANEMPFGDRTFDAVFAAGLVPHLTDPAAGLTEMGRVTRVGGRLAVFHPIGRAALAARHGGTPSEDDPLARGHIIQLLAATGWQLQAIDDSTDRYFALAARV
jgi:SAM-dependent methyltransferase